MLTKQFKKTYIIGFKYLVATTLVTAAAGALDAAILSFEASAQVIVYDPTNEAQNLLSAIRTLQSNVNEAQQLAYQLQNLQKLNYTSTPEYTSKYSGFLSQIQNLQGTLKSAAQAANAFQQAFPTSGFNSADFISNLEDWQKKLNQSTTDSVSASGAVLDSVPATQANMDGLVASSDNAQGALDAAQAGNRMIASLSGQLSQMNSQMATYQTAQMNAIAKQESQKAALDAEAVRIHTHKPYGTTPPTPNLYESNR